MPGRTAQVRARIERILGKLAPILFAAAVMAVLAWAWMHRAEGYLYAERGVGYWLGILSSVLMLVMIAYPLRKRLRVMQGVGRVAGWFRIHMMAGILAPALGLLHANFKIGSLNSSVALFTMLAVAASGIVGRYLYAHVHRGLYGQHVQMGQLLAEVANLRHALERRLPQTEAVQHALSNLFPVVSPKGRAPDGALSRLPATRQAARARRTILAVLKHLKVRDVHSGRVQPWISQKSDLATIDQQLRLLVRTIAAANRHSGFERLFGIWHHFHVPLFVVLAGAIVMHIVAVEFY